VLINPLRSMVGDYGALRRGVPREIPDMIAQRLIKAGRAERVQADTGAAAPAKTKTAPKEKTAPKSKGAAKSATTNPPITSPDGGQTGDATQSLSSEAGQALPTPPSETSGAAQD